MSGSGWVDRAVRAQSFGAVADDYDRYRPAPVPAAVEWLVPAGARTAVDLGAGTGALGELLARLVPEVVAVEPDRRMLTVLGHRVPAALRAVGRAEAIPLRDGSADVVGVSSAWHWMAQAEAVLEAARVLRPGGVLGVLWSGPDRSVPWVADVLGAGRGQPESAAPRADRWRHQLELAAGAPFGVPEGRIFSASVPYRVQDLVGLAASYSSVIALPDAERDEALARVAARVAAHPEFRGQESVTLPLRCACWRAVRHGRLSRGAGQAAASAIRTGAGGITRG